MDEQTPPPLSTPLDAMTPLSMAAAVAHEYFTELLVAGFTEGQALYLVGQMATAEHRA